MKLHKTLTRWVHTKLYSLPKDELRGWVTVQNEPKYGMGVRGKKYIKITLTRQRQRLGMRNFCLYGLA